MAKLSSGSSTNIGSVELSPPLVLYKRKALRFLAVVVLVILAPSQYGQLIAALLHASTLPSFPG